MQSFTQDNCDKLLKLRVVNIEDYSHLKKHFQSLGNKINLASKRKSKQKKDLVKLWKEQNLDDELRPIFLSNIYITDESEFLYSVEEALSFGCKKEDIPNYINANYGIPKAAYKLKISEMRTYKEYYKFYTNIYNQVDRVLNKVEPPKEIRIKNHKALDEEKQKLESNKVVSIEKLKDRQKIYFDDKIKEAI